MSKPLKRTAAGSVATEESELETNVVTLDTSARSSSFSLTVEARASECERAGLPDRHASLIAIATAAGSLKTKILEAHAEDMAILTPLLEQL